VLEAEMLVEKLGKYESTGDDQMQRETLKSGSAVLIMIFGIKKIATVGGTVHN
jgi:hypothetical protein